MYIYIYWKWSIDITIFIWTQSYQSAVETATLRTSQDITTYTYIYIYLKWSIDRNLFIWTHSYQSAVETPTLRTSQDITTYIYIYILLTYLHLYDYTVINQLWRPPHLEHPKTLQHVYIYIRSSTHIEYGIEFLASPGIPGIELEKRYLEYFRIQLTSKKLYLVYRWTIQILSLVQTNSSFFHGNSSLFFINPARFHTNSSLFQFFVI